MLMLGKLNLSKALTGNSSTNAANYVQHAMIDGKPRLQRVGTNLEEITLSLYLHNDIVDVNNIISTLYTFKDNAEPQALIQENGTLEGRFVVSSVDVNIIERAARGTIMIAEVSISLLEALNLNDEVFDKAKAFGLITYSPTEVKPKYVKPQTDAGQVNASMMQMQAANQQIDADVQSVVANPQTAASTLQRTKANINQAKKALNQMNELINNVRSNIYDAAFELRGYINVMYQSYALLENAINTATVSSIDAANTTLQSAGFQFTKYGNPIAVMQALRR